MLNAVLLSFLAGVLFATFSSSLEALIWSASILVPVCIGAMNVRRAGLFALLITLSFIAGYARLNIANRPAELEGHIGERVHVEGYVDGDFKPTATGAQFPFHAVSVNDLPITERILVRTDAYPQYRYGATLVLEGELEEPWKGDADFNYQAYLKKDGIRTVLEKPLINTSSVPLSHVRYGWRTFRTVLIVLRDYIATGIKMSVPEPASAYLNGIILGLRQDLPAELVEAFSRTGTTHVLAISGYNVAIVAFGIMYICLRFADRRRAVLIAVLAISAFTLLTGATASVVRAAIMGSLVLLAEAWGTRFRSMTLVLSTAVAMVLVNPFVLRSDIGFQLSFAAVAGLIFLVPILKAFISLSKRYSTISEIILATLAAQIATLPLILFHFGTLSPYSLPANALILPLVPFAMGLGAVSSVGWMMSPAVGSVLGIPAWAIASWQLNVVRFFSDLPGASSTVPLPWYGMALCYIALITIIVRYGNLRSDDSIDRNG